MRHDVTILQGIRQGITLETLGNAPIWVAYSGAPKADGKINKAPLNPKTRTLAKNDSPFTWATRKAAEVRSKGLKAPGHKPGVGVQLGDLGEGIALCGVDLDGCHGPEGLEPWAQEICDRFKTYGEISPSGKGVKLFVRVRSDDVSAARKVMGNDHRKEWKRGSHYGAELHLSNSYFTVTGRTYGGFGPSLRSLTRADLLWLIKEAGPAFLASPDVSKTSPRGRGDRSAEAFKMTLDLAQQGMTEAEAREALAEDEGLAGDWWNDTDTDERQRNRCIANAFAANVTRVEAERARLTDTFEDEPEEDWIDAFLFGRETPPAPAVGFGGPVMMQNGKPIINLNNATLFLGRDVDSILPGLRLNLMTGRNEWRGGPLTDADLALARTALERVGLKTIGKDLVAEATLSVARARPFHPIRGELAALRHDGKARLDTWLVRHLGADDTPYTRAVGRKFLVQMVARVMQPGCKADHTLVLSGPQGQGKSTVCRILAGPDYFSDTLPAIAGDKTEAIRHLQGKWLVELAELAPSRKSEAEDLKAFLSGARDRVRLPYARFDEEFPRQCVFVGTTNEDQFLRDATGGRRFWPVTVRKVIDAAALEADRGQLFAEAFAAYSAGEAWWLDRNFEAEHARPVQEAAHMADGWTDTVAAWLDRPTDDFDGPSITRDAVTVSEVLEGALGVTGAQQSMAAQKRVADAMRRLGWTKAKNNGRMVWRRVPK